MKSRITIFFLVVGVLPCMGVEPAAEVRQNRGSPPGKPLFTWDLLWTGSWYRSVPRAESGFPPIKDFFPGGTLFNRGDLSLTLPRQDLSFRFMATDKRVLPVEDENTKAGFNPGLGMYHNASGSRFLQGVQSEYGLPARINNVWLRSVPFMEYRGPSSRDLKTEPAAKDKGESYLYLALPAALVPGFGAFASAGLDAGQNPALGGGIGLGDPGGAASGAAGAEFRLEGYYTQKTLPPRTISTWFSQAPPLPERDFRIYALAMIFNSPRAAFASDWAWSETFAWGRGMYGNFALRLGDKPWRFSLAGDGAGSRFAGRDGSTLGAGFRVAAKGERFWPRSGYLRFQGIFRGPAVGEAFQRSSLSVYFRPSAPSAKAARENTFPIRFSRASLDFNRDARTPAKTDDTLAALFGFYLGPISAVFSCSLHSLSSLEEGGTPPLFQSTVFETFESFKISGELGFNAGIFNLRTTLGYTTRAEKDPIWEPSVNASVRPGKWGRLSLNIAATDFPGKWNYTLSWRFAVNGEMRNRGLGAPE